MASGGRRGSYPKGSAWREPWRQASGRPGSQSAPRLNDPTEGIYHTPGGFQEAQKARRAGRTPGIVGNMIPKAGETSFQRLLNKPLRPPRPALTGVPAAGWGGAAGLARFLWNEPGQAFAPKSADKQYVMTAWPIVTDCGLGASGNRVEFHGTTHSDVQGCVPQLSFLAKGLYAFSAEPFVKAAIKQVNDPLPGYQGRVVHCIIHPAFPGENWRNVLRVKNLTYLPPDVLPRGQPAGRTRDNTDPEHQRGPKPAPRVGGPDGPEGPAIMRGFPKRPGKKVKQRKAKVPQFLLKAIGAFTEGLDAALCAFEALPKKRKVGVKDGVAIARAIYRHYDEMDMGKLVICLASNEVQDRLLAKMDRGMRKAFGSPRSPFPTRIGAGERYRAVQKALKRMK